MKFQLWLVTLAVALLTGCAETRSSRGGTAANDHSVLTGGPTTGTTIDQLPEPVKAALQRRASRAEIADIDKTMRGGQEVYEISFHEPERNPRVYITPAGKLLPDPELPDTSP